MTPSAQTQVRPDTVLLSRAASAAVTLLCLILTALWSVLLLQPKAMRLPAGRQQRLLAHVSRIAAAPHPLGTPEHDRVRDYILQTLRQDGLSPQVQRATAVLDAKELYRVADLQNILVRVPGRASGRALLVAAHYDSAPVSLGAADDGAAVACMLELAGDLQRGPAPTNDIIFLFSDGEEWGMLGARSFLTHPWSKDVGAMVNLDARGTGGRPVLLQTSGDDMSLVPLLNRSRAPLWAASYVAAGYRASGNDTDFSIFEKQDWPGFNIAFFDKPENYHTAHDEPRTLDPATLVELDISLERLVRTLADAQLDQLTSGGRAMFGSLPGEMVLAIPLGFARPLAVALLVCALAVAIGRRRSRWKAVAATLIRAVIGAALAVAIVAAIDLELGKALGGLVRWEDHDGFFWAALLAVSGLTMIAFASRSQTSGDVDRETSVGALVLLLSLAGCAVAFVLPQAALLLLGPALLGCLVMVMPRGFRFAPLLLVLAAFLWIQTVWQLATGLGMRAQWLVLILGALLALVSILAAIHGLVARRAWAAGLIGLALIVGVTASATARYDAGHPRKDHLLEAVDLESKSASWFTIDDQPDAWNSRYLTNIRRGNLRSFFGGHDVPGYSSSQSYPSALSASKLSFSGLEGDTADLQLAAQPGASAIRIDIYSEGAILAAKIGDAALALHSAQDAAPGQARFTLVYLNPPKSPVALRLKLEDPHSLAATLLDVSFGIHTVPRPPDITASPESPTDGLYIRQSFEFLKEN